MPTPAVDSSPAALPRWLRGLVIIAVVLGIVLRLTNVSHKAVGLDEGWTALRISGYGDREVQLVTGKIISNRQLQQFQFPHQDRRPLEIVQHLARNSPELPPSYFLMLRGWVRLLGQTITSLRLFSVMLGILLIPAVYWLGREIFPHTRVGAIAMALVAQSPFHLLYNQEANAYSLWALMIVLSSAALVRALVRALRQPSAWALYGSTVALGLYCHALHGLVLIAHMVCVAWTGLNNRRVWKRDSQQKRRAWKQDGQPLRQRPSTLRRYAIASLGGCLLFAPWLLFALANFDSFQTTGMTTKFTPVAAQSSLNLGLVQSWVKGGNLPLLDFPLSAGNGSSGAHFSRLGLVLGGNLVWMAIALWRFALQAPSPGKQILLSTLGSTTVLLLGSDLFGSGLLGSGLIPETQRAITFHPWLPAVLSLQLIMAFVLARWLAQGPRRWGQFLVAGLLTTGLLSNGVMVMGWDWWSKVPAINANLELPTLVRQHQQRQTSLAETPGVKSLEATFAPQPPLFVSDASWRYAMAASHALPDQAQWLLLSPGEQPIIPDEYQDFYLYNPTTELLSAMQQQHQVRPFNQAYWQVSRS